MTHFAVSVLRGPQGFAQVVVNSSFEHEHGFPFASEIIEGCGLVETGRSVSPDHAAREIHNISVTIAGADEFEARVLSATHSLTGEPVVLLIEVQQ